MPEISAAGGSRETETSERPETHAASVKVLLLRVPSMHSCVLGTSLTVLLWMSCIGCALDGRDGDGISKGG